MQNIPKPRLPIIDGKQYSVREYLDKSVLDRAGFSEECNVEATRNTSDKMPQDPIFNLEMESSSRADELRVLSGTKVLKMAYLYAEVKYNEILRKDDDYSSETKDLLNEWAQSLYGIAKEIVDEFQQVVGGISRELYKCCVTVQYDGPTPMREIKNLRGLEPWYVFCSILARKVGFEPEHDPEDPQDAMFRPRFWLARENEIGSQQFNEYPISGRHSEDPYVAKIDAKEYYVRQYLDKLVLDRAGFSDSRNVGATEKINKMLQDPLLNFKMESSLQADKLRVLKGLPGTKVLKMAYHYAEVKYSEISGEEPETRALVNEWAQSLSGTAQEIVKEFKKVVDELYHAVDGISYPLDEFHAIIRYDESGSTREIKTRINLEPWYVFCSVVARKVGFERAVGAVENHLDAMLRHIVWLAGKVGGAIVQIGFCLYFVAECAIVNLTHIGSNRSRYTKIQVRYRASLRRYEEWSDSNRLAHGEPTKPVDGYRSPVHILNSDANRQDQDFAQGFLLLGCVVVLHYFNDNALQPLSMLYDDPSQKHFIVGKSAEKSVARLLAIKYDPRGGHVSSSVGRLVGAWAYIIFVATMAVLVGLYNLGCRNSVFLRITDSVGVATAGLVAVFGLIKLFRRDPDAILNLLIGRKVLTTVSEIESYLDLSAIPRGMDFKTYLKVCAASLPEPVEWAKKEQTCYLIDQVDGNIRLAGGVSGSELAAAGIFTDGNSYFRYTVPAKQLYSVISADGDMHLAENSTGSRPVTIESSVVLGGS